MKRPETIPCHSVTLETGLGRFYVNIGEVGGKPHELQITGGKSGNSVRVKAEVVGRLVTLAFKHKIPIEEIVNELEGIGGENAQWNASENSLVLSIPDGVGKILRKMYVSTTKD